MDSSPKRHGIAGRWIARGVPLSNLDRGALDRAASGARIGAGLDRIAEQLAREVFKGESCPRTSRGGCTGRAGQ